MRAKEIEQGALGFIEHGWTGRFIEAVELGLELGLKPIIGSEAYFVKDRFSKDATNAHIVILAKNESGRKQLNLALSEANLTGFYYKPRLDLELLQTLSPENVWVTTACPGGVWKYGAESEEILLFLHRHFQNSLFLEVQNHNTDVTKAINFRILDLSGRHGIKIIAGMDSHMIYEHQAGERDGYLASRGISYPDEDGWHLDYPDYDTAFQRFEEQGILNKYKIEEALDTTNILLNVEEYKSIIFDSDFVKLPTIYPNRNLHERNQILTDLVMGQWEKEKSSLPSSAHSHYEEEIKKELDIVFKTGMSDYFLLDYEIIKKGVEKGGSITMTGRGSAPSFYLSKLLGFTTIDRIAASVKLFPERFISTDRLLETKNLPDIDFNLGTPDIFAEAQKDVLGDNHAEQMLAFGTVQSSGAWKMHARNIGVNFDTANLVSDQIRKYEKALIHADLDEDIDKENLNELDFLDKKYHDDFLESRKYLGIVNTVSVHPCASLLFNHGNIKEEFGVIKIKTGDVEHICACCDGLFAEKYKLLKNDLLKVTVVDLIHRVYKKVGIEPHPLPELIELCKGDERVWEVYSNAWTMGINQVEPHATASKATKYKPTNISELSAFVAAIRPGFQSYYQRFENREPFEYGVKSLDDIIQTKEFPHSYMLYQENAMQVMAYAGIPMSETYDAIKNIAKKRADKVLAYRKVFINGITKRIMEEDGMQKSVAKRIAEETWQVIEDSSRYSFNASHAYSVAGDSLYGAYLKAHHSIDFYETLLRIYEDDGDKDRIAKARVEAEKAYGIKFPPFRFGQDNREIVADKSKSQITSSLKTIKGFGKAIGNQLYGLSQEFDGKDFVDLLVFAEEKNQLSSKWDKLIKINYFAEFGGNIKLLKIFEEFRDGKNRYSRKYVEKTKSDRIDALRSLFANMYDEKMDFLDQVRAEQEILGFIHYSDERIDKRYFLVTGLDTKYAPRLQAYCLSTGRQESIKVQTPSFDACPFEEGDIIYGKRFEQRSPLKYVDGKFVENTEGEPQWWITSYNVVPYDMFKEVLERL